MVDVCYYTAFILVLLFTVSSAAALGVDISIVYLWLHRHDSQAGFHFRNDSNRWRAYLAESNARSYFLLLATYITGLIVGVTVLATLLPNHQTRSLRVRTIDQNVAQEVRWSRLAITCFSIVIPLTAASIAISFRDNRHTWYYWDVCEHSLESGICQNSKPVTIEQWFCTWQQPGSNVETEYEAQVASYCLQAQIVRRFTVPYLIIAMVFLAVVLFEKQKINTTAFHPDINSSTIAPIDSKTKLIVRIRPVNNPNYGGTVTRSLSDTTNGSGSNYVVGARHNSRAGGGPKPNQKLAVSIVIPNSDAGVSGRIRRPIEANSDRQYMPGNFSTNRRFRSESFDEQEVRPQLEILSI